MEPNQQMDKLLRAYAEKRRAEAGEPKLEQVTRNLLQAEVARQLREPQQHRNIRELLGALWPRLALAGGLAATLLLLAYFFPAPEKTRVLADGGERRLEPVAPSAMPAAPGLGVEARQTRPEPVADLAATPASEESLSSPGSKAKTLRVSPSKKTPLQTSAVASVAAAPAAGLPSQPPSAVITAETPTVYVSREKKGESVYSFARNGVGQREGEAFGTRQVDSTALALGAQVNGLKEKSRDSAPTGSWQFSQSDHFVQVKDQRRGNLASPPRPALLRSFKLEREGEEVRIVDEDGSVYVGRVEPLSVGFGAYAMQARGDSNAPASAVVSNVTFHVQGTNRTLNKVVVFNGEIQVARQDGASPGRAQSERINGQVKLGDETEFMFEAIRKKPD